MADILSNSVSGLLAVQRALTTTGHNVSNANTEGYSRQRVSMSAQVPQFMGNGYIGTGTKVDSITRSFDQFVESQLRDATSDSSRLSYIENFASQVTGVLGDTETGIAASTDAFFNAAGDVASNPTDITSRQAFLNQAGALADHFNRVDAQLAQLDQGIGQQAEAISREINTFANEVADLNDKITTAYAQDPNALPNDLLDRRDKLITDIAERINVRVVDDGAGSLNLAVGTGQPLVTANMASQLTTTNAPGGLQVSIDGQSITHRVTGGDLGGMIEAQETLIQPLRSELGRTAMVVAQEVNAIQKDGFDLNGDPGKALFNVGQGDPNNDLMGGSVIASPGNEGAAGADVAITDATLLESGRYVARFDGSVWKITKEDGSGASTTVDPTSTSVTTDIPGMSIDFDSAGAKTGDRLFIDAGLGVAGRITTTDLGPAEVAAAGSVVDSNGDSVSAGSRDNTNIQKITEMGNQGVVGQSTSDFGASADPDALDGETIAGSLSSAVSQAGSVARTAELQGESARAALDNLEARKQSVSGVNLDEEAAKLLQYQQQYQALARSISIAGELFQSVLNAVR
ncbi:flagellar hook-associated protein FlgK [Guyparkeria hydrothermalis]|uniref:flagellar hook-associated protein FlgK n=1 Tax=Guyparkeria hydrothermalis TaxID=923 RepID=UPI0020204BE4|nr:flagellar hook-associated protein FlgK [Guyparkeria hydrothermalis]MCL7743444.1 flagellar hook-associated protein FlgK [Guyparkeria hydrothermalis]